MVIKDRTIQSRTINALLEKLGLSRNETRCYLSLLVLGPTGIALLAKHARVNRVNAYDAIRRLVQWGLALQEMKGAKRGLVIHPAPLAHLLELARAHQKRASSLRWKIEDIILLTNAD